jgi:DNA-binding MarR family transcriptional regulator
VSPARPPEDSRWQPRKVQPNGQSMWIRTFDGMAVAIIRARLKHPASWAVLMAIHYRQQRDYRKRAQAITVRTFASETGFPKSKVQQALKELESRRVIEVRRGNGRREASVYEVTYHSRWTEPEG